MKQVIKAYTLRLPYGMWTDLRSIAKQSGISIADVVRALLKKDIEFVKSGGKVEL